MCLYSFEYLSSESFETSRFYERIQNTLLHATLIRVDFSRRSFPAYHSFSHVSQCFLYWDQWQREQVYSFRNVESYLAAIFSQRNTFDCKVLNLNGLASNSSFCLPKHSSSCSSYTMQQSELPEVRVFRHYQIHATQKGRKFHEVTVSVDYKVVSCSTICRPSRKHPRPGLHSAKHQPLLPEWALLI